MTKYSLFTKQSREDEHFCAADAYLHICVEFVDVQLIHINMCVHLHLPSTAKR